MYFRYSMGKWNAGGSVTSDEQYGSIKKESAGWHLHTSKYTDMHVWWSSWTSTLQHLLTFFSLSKQNLWTASAMNGIILTLGFSHSVRKKETKGQTPDWFHLLSLQLFTSAEYMLVMKSRHSPPPPFLLLLFTCCRGGGGEQWEVGGEESVWREWGGLCLCVGGHGVSGGGKGSCLFEDSARSPRLVSPAWLFEAVRWPHRATLPQVGRGCCWRCHLYTAVSFILSSSPPPPTPLSLSLPSPLLFLGSLAPSVRPLQAL